MQKSWSKRKSLAVSLICLFAGMTVLAGFSATHIPTNYSMDQFVPAKHALMDADRESKKVFHISEASPYIVLLTYKKSLHHLWYDTQSIDRLEKLSNEIQSTKGVKSVISLGNIHSAFEKGGQLSVAGLNDLRKAGFDVQDILRDPLYTPNLISKDGLNTALFVTPEVMTQDSHRRLMGRLKALSRKSFPEATLQIGGPAAIRTQFIDLLSHEILIFILLSLVCAIVVIKVMFHGFRVVPQMLFILIIANTLTLGLMGYAHMSFNILSSTLPILVTITALGIATHTLVRMGEAADLPYSERQSFLRHLLRELMLPHFVTAGTTAVGFATLMTSKVPLIANYGLVVAVGVMVAAITTLVLLPCLYSLVEWPRPRDYFQETKHFARFLVREARWVTPAIGILVVVFLMIGTHLSWTARLFDDLPSRHSASLSTDLISRKLGGSGSVDFVIGGSSKDAWKSAANLSALKTVTTKWRHEHQIGSVLTLADFLATGADKKQMPQKREQIAELEFLYGMSGDSPLPQYLSGDEKWVRVAVRLPDLPADANQALIAKLRGDLKQQFPKMEIKVSGLAAVVPVINAELASELMWGFFESLFWIVLLLTVVFRSLRWALVAVLPNLVPPALLLGFLALFHIPIKPGIAIIFSISLGLAFCNTVYVLERLKTMLKKKQGSWPTALPIYTLMKKETMPCLVSSLSLFGGFSIFLFSVFPMNRLFGVFMLISIGAGLLGDLVWLPVLLRRFPRLLLEGEPKMKTAGLSTVWQNALRGSQYAVLIGLGLVAFHSAYATEDVAQILKHVEAQGAPPSERVDLKMIISDSDGSLKTRELSILRKNSGDARALIRLQKPVDLKGLALLTVTNGKKEDQYLYLPSDKKSRRILGSNKKGKFLDSEIAYEDLAISTYKDFNNKVLKDDGKTVEVESKAKANSESSYGKILTWIAKPDYRIERVDYFDKSNKLLKQTQFKNYEKVGNKFWRAREVLVKNVQARRGTKLLVEKVSLKTIDDEEVSLNALED